MDRTNLIERRFEFQTRALPIEGEDREIMGGGICGEIQLSYRAL